MEPHKRNSKDCFSCIQSIIMGNSPKNAETGISTNAVEELKKL